MEPGQLSISLYSVCKIQNLNTEPPSVDVGFFSTTYFVLSVRIMSVFIYFYYYKYYYFVIQVFEACNRGGWF